MERIVNALFGPIMRDSRHVEEQKQGRQMIAARLGIPGPWRPDMVNYPAFLCAHCQFPNMVRQTLLGCASCAAPYLPSEVVLKSRNGPFQCSACAAEQAVGAMPFCCTNCRCIQGVPSRLDWRRTFTQYPSWRFTAGPVVTLIAGLLVMLACALSSQAGRGSHSDGPMVVGILFGLMPAIVGAIVLAVVLFDKKTPAELLLSCGGFGIRTEAGEERWFSWQDVRALDARQSIGRTSVLVDTSASGHPDSTATGWILHTTQEQIFFNYRFKEAQEFARQIRMRAPAAPILDLPWIPRSNPWTVWIVAMVLFGVVMGMIALLSTH